MEITVKDLVGKTGADVNVEELKKQLRRLPEAERFSFIQECLAHGLISWALALAKSCLRSGEYVARLLEHGLRVADASSIKYWLECAVAKLGGRRVVRIVASQLESNPEGVAKAVYWLPGLLSRKELKTAAAFDELVRAAGEKGILRKPKVMPNPDKPGHVLFGNVWAEDDT